MAFLYGVVILKKYTKEEAVGILHSTAKDFQEKMAGRLFLVIYCDKLRRKMLYKKLQITKNNFMHLTGINYEGNITAGDFFKMCLNGRLSPRKLLFRNDGFSEMKLSVLPYLSDLFHNPFWIGDSINNDITINADYFAGDKKCVLCLGFRSNKCDYPVSLKCQSIREVVKKKMM